MKSIALWLFATAVFLGASLMTGSLVHAGTTPQPDHLKCYKVAKDTNPRETEIVRLFNQQFPPETECKLIIKAPLFCAPTVKNDSNDDRGPALTTDFLCYKVTCPKQEEINVLANDQFGFRQITIDDARLLCTPTVKSTTPTCENTSAPQCGGLCPTPGQTCKPVTAGTAVPFCRCQ